MTRTISSRARNVEPEVTLREGSNPLTKFWSTSNHFYKLVAASFYLVIYVDNLYYMQLWELETT